MSRRGKNFSSTLPHIQRSKLNNSLLMDTLMVPTSSKSESIAYMKEMAERLTSEGDISFDDALADVYRYFRKVNGHILSYDR